MLLKYERKQYEIPSEGVQRSKLVKVEDIGVVTGAFGAQEKICFTWEVDELDSQGKPRLVFQRFRKSLHPKSNLSKTIKQLTGEDPGTDFETDELVGIEADLVISHTENEGIVYANVSAIIPIKTQAEVESERRVQQVIDRARQGSKVAPTARQTQARAIPGGGYVCFDEI